MCNTFNISAVHLWNRTKNKADDLAAELEALKSTFLNKNLEIFVHDGVDSCVAQSDIIVTATNTRTPLIFANLLKANVHINGTLISKMFTFSFAHQIYSIILPAVGAGVNHHSEIDGSVYEKSKIYVDNWAGADSELKALSYPIEGEVGEVINGVKGTPSQPITIFHSLGMAVEDAATGQLVEELYRRDARAQ